MQQGKKDQKYKDIGREIQIKLFIRVFRGSPLCVTFEERYDENEEIIKWLSREGTF
jgi:hypothetical protein